LESSEISSCTFFYCPPAEISFSSCDSPLAQKSAALLIAMPRRRPSGPGALGSFPQFSLLPSELKLHVAMCASSASVFGRLARCDRAMASLCKGKARWAMDRFAVEGTECRGLKIFHALPDGSLHGEAREYFAKPAATPPFLQYKANWVHGLLDGPVEEWKVRGTTHRLIRRTDYRRGLRDGEEHLYRYNFERNELVEESVATYARNQLCGSMRDYSIGEGARELTGETFWFESTEFTSRSEMERVMRNAQERIDARDNKHAWEEVYWPRV